MWEGNLPATDQPFNCRCQLTLDKTTALSRRSFKAPYSGAVYHQPSWHRTVWGSLALQHATKRNRAEGNIVQGAVSSWEQITAIRLLSLACHWRVSICIVCEWLECCIPIGSYEIAFSARFISVSYVVVHPSPGGRPGGNKASTAPPNHYIQTLGAHCRASSPVCCLLLNLHFASYPSTRWFCRVDSVRKH